MPRDPANGGDGLPATSLGSPDQAREARHLLGESRQPVALLLAKFRYKFFRPGRDGMLEPSQVDDFGPDVFAVAGQAAIK